MSTFWHGFIIVLTVLSMVACLWLLLAMSRGHTGEQTTHTWDDDLTEYNNPLPRWWLNLFILTLVFGVGYLAFYPGLGNLAGRLGWTSQGEMQARLDTITAQRRAQYQRLAGKSLTELAQDPTAQSLGRAIFVANCAGCHGTDAHGAIGFPDLADHDSLFGTDPDTLLASITNGRGAQMPAFNGALSVEATQALLDFIPFWSDPSLSDAKREAGMKQFSMTCAACHGAQGQGNIAMGAPNLTDDVWLFGGSVEQVRHTILFGRSTQMPAHKDILSTDELRVVAAYVYALTQAPPEQPEKSSAAGAPRVTSAVDAAP